MKKIHWPIIKIPEGFIDAESYLKHLVYEGVKEKYVDDDSKYADIYKEERRKYINHELENLKGFEPYFILLYDLMQFCRSKNITVTPGYGSAANSIVNYCLGITTVEPDCLSHFELFFLKGTDRIPQITIQVDDTRVDDLINYLKSVYGENHVMRAGVGYRRDLKKKCSERVPIYAAHFCGIFIFDRPFHEVTETIEIKEKYSDRKILVPRLTIQELEYLGYVNINIMGMKSLSLVSQTLQLIAQNRGEYIDFNNISNDDPDTLVFLSSGHDDIDKIWNAKGFANDLCEIKPSYMNDLCAVNSLWTLPLNSNRNYYKFLAKEDETDESFTLFYENFCECTRGLLFYHEQIVLILYLLSELSVAECEKIRRYMKYPDYMPIQKSFMKSVKKLGLHSITEAEEIWRYFIKNHRNTISFAHYYCLTVFWYRTTWLRVHYPEEFRKCYLQNK